LDVPSGDIVYTELNAHDGAIWSLDLRRPNSNSTDLLADSESFESSIAVVTGSADKIVKFWDVERQDDEDDDAEEGGGRHRHHHHHHRWSCTPAPSKCPTTTTSWPSATPAPPPSTRRSVWSLSRRWTVPSRYLVHVFFDDTLKFFLSLYGHKLPALAVDSSDDDAILAMGGADKTIKIWGLDFGDTHRTLHGHVRS